MTIEIEIAFALPGRQIIRPMQVAQGTRARDAVQGAGIEKEFPGIDPSRCSIGVFGRCVADDHVLRNGDRVEIYRPLQMDPREARRRLAARGETMRRS